MAASQQINAWKTELSSCRTSLEATRAAIYNILSGKAQSYGIGSRSKTAYGMTMTELQSREKWLLKRISELEALIAGRGCRRVQSFIPTDL